MSKVEYTICDICYKKIPNPRDIFTIKVRSAYFVSYVDCDAPFADRKKIDICKDCLYKFRDFVKHEQQLQQG